MTLDRFLQHVLPRDIARAWQDSSAPVAMTIAEQDITLPSDDDPEIQHAVQKLRTVTADESDILRKALLASSKVIHAGEYVPKIDFNFRLPGIPDRTAEEMAAIVDTLLRHVTAGWTLTARGKARVRDGIVRGLVEAGVVR